MDPNVKEISKRDPDVICNYCHKSEINSLEWGPLYQLEGVTVHYFCMLFSAGLSQNGEDEEGILGFMPKDIRKELKRGAKLKCKFCRQPGATIGCSTKSCKTSYHYPCGLEKNSVFQFIGNFKSYCEKHRHKDDIPYQYIDLKCPICFEEVSDRNYPLWTPCCKKRIFHKTCIMEMAKNHAAHFFKCPLCNDKDIFSVAMRKSGIFLPDRDATWELEPNAFGEQNEVYSRCDAKTCSCPKGRDYSSSSESKPYKIVRCGACAGTAVHVKCGKLKNLTWRCQTCSDILSGQRMSEGLNSSRIQRQRYDTSEDEDVGNPEPEPIVKLRDAVSTTVLPESINKVKEKNRSVETAVGSRFVVERSETDSEGESDTDQVFISERSHMARLLKVRGTVRHIRITRKGVTDSPSTLNEFNSSVLDSTGHMEPPNKHELSIKVHNGAVSSSSLCNIENRVDRYNLYSKKLNDVKCCRQNPSTTTTKARSYASTTSDNVSIPVHVSSVKTSPLRFPPLVKSNLIKTNSKANLKQIHQPVNTGCQPHITSESSSLQVKLVSNRPRPNVNQQQHEVIAVNDDSGSGSDVEILSEKIVPKPAQSSAFQEIVAKAREKRQPHVNLGYDDDENDNIEFLQKVTTPGPTMDLSRFQKNFEISNAFLKVIETSRKGPRKTYHSSRPVDKRRSIEVVSLDSDDDDHSRGSSSNQGATRTCSKQPERLMVTDSSRNSKHTQAKRARV